MPYAYDSSFLISRMCALLCSSARVKIFKHLVSQHSQFVSIVGVLSTGCCMLDLLRCLTSCRERMCFLMFISTLEDYSKQFLIVDRCDDMSVPLAV